MLEYFKKQGLKVYQPEEVLLSIKKELDIFYQDSKRYALFFQDIIIDTYDTVLKNIDSVIDDYDIIILERTHIDTEVFTNINIKNQLKLFTKKYLILIIKSLTKYSNDFLNSYCFSLLSLLYYMFSIIRYQT